VLELARKEEERRAAREALKKSEENYRMLVNNLPAMVYKGYADWSMDFYDDKVELITGYQKEEFDSRRMKWCDVLLPEDQEKAKQEFIYALKTNLIFRREYRIRTHSKEIIWIHDKGQIVCDPSGQVEYIAGVFFDITPLKEARLKRREAEKEREKVIGELKEALAQVKTLKGLLPICANCKNIRDKKGSWRQMESYIREHSQADFSHSICPECVKKLYPEYLHEKEE
jgi:PAS domain S-box-containing protein